jgi:hypothetical protein
MGYDKLEFLHDVCLFILRGMLQHVVVSDNLLILSIINRYHEFDPGGVVFNFGLMVFNNLNYSASEYLTIFLFSTKKVWLIKSSGLKTGGGGKMSLVSPLVGELAGVDLLVHRKEARSRFDSSVSPPDMLARKLTSSGVAAHNKDL